MLENLRKQGASWFIWIVFAILIGMFVLNFGQQSAGAQQGCSLSSGNPVALKVGRSEIDDTGLRLSANLARQVYRIGDTDMLTRLTFERLVMRELLATEAERRGLRIPDSLVDEAITSGQFHFAGLVQRGQPIPPVTKPQGLFFTRLKDEDEEPTDPTTPPSPGETYFNYRVFKRFLANMSVSVGAYKREHNREMLASTMARILLHSVPVSREEALAQYISDNTRVSFNTVRFDANRYADALRITNDDLDRFMRGHDAEVKAAYVADAWKGKDQIHVRRIFVAKAPPPAAPNPPAQPTDGSAAPAPVPPPAPDPAIAKLGALRDQIASGKRGFAEAASGLDADPMIAARGGDWGWYYVATPT